MAEWEVRRVRGAAADVHARDLDPTISRSVTLVDVDGSAIVLGSTQPAEDVDEDVAATLDIAVVRRRSGGGAVLLVPGDAVWIDVEIGRDDPLWTDDVSRSMLWLGRAWVDALTTMGVVDARVHGGPMRAPDLATVVCFAGLAPGEVTIDGAKVVGISQRRTRAGARLQCAVPRAWDRQRYSSLLAPGLARVGSTDGLDRVGVRPVGSSAETILGAFLRALPH